MQKLEAARRHYKGGRIPAYVDIHADINSAQNLEAPVESPTTITARGILAQTTAAAYPLKCEGNLVRPPGPPGPPPKEFHWEALVKETLLKVEILSVDATEPSATKLKCRVEPSSVTLDSVDFKITEAYGGEIHSDSKASVSGDFEFTFDQTVLERSAWVWDEDGSTDEIGPNALKIIGHKGSMSCEDSCEGRRDTHWTAYAGEIVQAYFLVEGVGLRLYGHDLAESYDKFSCTVPFTGKDLWIGTSHIILDVNSPEDYSNISWGESHKYNNAGGDFGAQTLGAAQGNESEHKFYNGHSYTGWPDPTNLKGIARVDSLFWGTFGAIQYSNREVDRSIP